MNELGAKKLGKILAYINTTLLLCDKGKIILQLTLGEQKVTEMVDVSKAHKDSVHALADRAKVLNTVMSKLETTEEKLSRLIEIQINGEWDNAEKLLTWFGFFEGMVLVDSSILLGISEETGHAELQSFADSYYTYHKELFGVILSLAHDWGRDKTKGSLPI